ncbi:MAG TPA: glycosyltransferase family 4 protein [Solirubrobacterales bacterium]|jgi:glycosyltransferase involved in cell wall biosynthesis|nr:glycosyltransferase family 4 protein [Solirubrobacterales bacterium]
MSAERILILVQNEPLPHDRHVLNESRALVKAGYDVTVICPRGIDREREPYEVFDGIKIHRYEARPAGERTSEYLVEYLAALRSMRKLARRLAKEEPFDLVHACSPPDFMLLSALSLRRQGARFVFDHHDLTPELFRSRYGGGPLHWATYVAEQVAFRSADVVLSVNESYRRIAIERGRRDPDDVFVVRTGPDLTHFAPTEPDESRKRGKPFLLAYVGVMGAQDGVDEALRSLAELAKLRRDWHAIFMGDGDVVEEMKAMSSSLGLDDLVEFTGWVEQDTICRVLSTADLGIAPDPKNPLNDVSSMIKISEYMAMSTPIVSFDLAESRVGAGDAAVFAPSGDHAAWAHLASDLLDDPDRCATMGAAGRQRVLDFIAWEHQERSLLAAYRHALAMGPARETRTALLRRLAFSPS